MRRNLLLLVTVLGAASLDAGTITFNNITNPTTVEGSVFTGILASFSNTDTMDPASDYTATINWGDGTTTNLSSNVGGSGGSFSVNGSHTYAEEGTYTTSLTVTDTNGNATATGTGTATVNDAPLFPNPGLTIGYLPNVALSNVLVATFTDGNPDGSATDFTATINWGDGSAPSMAMVLPGTGNLFDVDGSHTYAVAGTFTVAVTVNDQGGSTATVLDTATTPEPGSIAMVCAGLALVGLKGVRRGRTRAHGRTRILDDVTRFCNGHFHDDASLIVVTAD